MSVMIEQGAIFSTVRLGGDIGICAAVELRGVLIEAISSGLDIKVEFAGVTALDITTLQLLWAADLAADRAGTKLLQSGPIPAAVEAAMDLARIERLTVSSR